MGYNIPTFVENNFSFGPAVVFAGAAGATPSTDIGAINASDGVTIAFGVESSPIEQGNPQMEVYAFATRHEFRVSFNSIEWNFNNLALLLGAGATSQDTTPTRDRFAMGGDPKMLTLALQVQHAMAQSGHTLTMDVWKARGEPSVEVQLGQEVHTFPATFKAQRVTTNWAGGTLDRGQQLVRFTRTQ